MDIITWNMIDEVLREVKKISEDMETVKTNLELIQRKLEHIEAAKS